MQTLDECIQSIRQCRTPVRHIFVDGKSSDGTAEYLADYALESDHVSVHAQHGKGLYDALNQGVQEALKDKDVRYVGLLHSDDYVVPESFDRYVVSIATNQAQVNFSDIEFRNDEGNVVRTWTAGEFSTFKLNTGWMPPHTSMIVSREIYEQYSLYNADFGTAADYDWIVRVLSSEADQPAYFPEVTVAMRTGGASNASLGARLRANAMDGRVWSQRSRIQAAMIRFMKPARKINQFF